jgi:uncharacterized protein (TIRG00374 family)
MKKLFSNVWVNLLFMLSLTLAALVFALYDSFETVINTIINLQLHELLIIMFWGFIPYLLWGAVLTVLGRTIMPKFKLSQGIVNAYVGGFMSGITPSSTGGQVAQTLAYRKSGMKASQGAGLVWMDFFFFQFTFIITAFVLYFIFLGTFRNLAINVVFAISLAANSALVVLLWIMIQFPRLYHRIVRWSIVLLHKLKFVKNKEKILEDWNSTITHFTNAIAVSNNAPVFWKVTGLYFLRHIAYFSTPFAIGQLLGLPIAWTDYWPMLALANFISCANTFVPLPGSSGATESLFVLVFSTVIGKSAAASTMILWRFANFYVPLLVGGYFFVNIRHINPLKPIQTEDLLKPGEDDANSD